MREYDPRSFGAAGDGRTKDTEALQNCLDACARTGGRVVLAHGTFLTGTLFLRENTELHLASDGVLLGSPDCADYPEFEKHYANDAFMPRRQGSCLLFAERACGIRLTGTGVIDGNGAHFVERVPEGERYWMPYRRIKAPTPPRLCFFVGCRDVRVEQITVKDPPAAWSFWISDCEDVVFEGTKIRANLAYPNNDGIHLNSCRRVTVTHCDIACGDDCIVVRANNATLPENHVCEQVTVSDCLLSSRSAAIRVAWVNDGTIRDCRFSDLTVKDATTGVSLYLPSPKDAPTDVGREETTVESMVFERIRMERILDCPLLFYVDPDPETRVKRISGLRFSDVTAACLHLPLLRGRRDHPITDVTFERCSCTLFDRDELPEGTHLGAVQSYGVPKDQFVHSFVEIKGELLC